MSSSQKTSPRSVPEGSQLSLRGSGMPDTEPLSRSALQAMSVAYTNEAASSSARRAWPTPTRRDWQDAGNLATSMIRKTGRGRDEMLARVVFVEHIRLTGSPPMGYDMSPAWVESLMGFPAGWTELDALPPKSPRKPAGPRVRVNLSSPGKPRASRKASGTAVTD